MSALSRLFVIPIWEMYFISQKLAPLWSCIEMNLRTSFIPMLYYSVLFSSLSFCLFVFFSSKITSFAFFTLYALFPNEGSTFFPLQVLCSALNHDLPTHVFWGISVSNWYVWHLFNKLWKYFQEGRNTREKCCLNAPSFLWAPAVLGATSFDSSETASWLCGLLSFTAVAILCIYWEKTVLMYKLPVGVDTG